MNAITLTEKYYAIEINSRIRSDKCFKSKMFFSYYMQDRYNYGCVQLAKIVKRKHNMIVYYKNRMDFLLRYDKKIIEEYLNYIRYMNENL